MLMHTKRSTVFVYMLSIIYLSLLYVSKYIVPKACIYQTALLVYIRIYCIYINVCVCIHALRVYVIHTARSDAVAEKLYCTACNNDFKRLSLSDC